MTKTKRVTKDKCKGVPCDHEPMIWAENQGSKIWICQCGSNQYVSGTANGDVLAPLTGKQKITRPEGGFWPVGPETVSTQHVIKPGTYEYDVVPGAGVKAKQGEFKHASVGYVTPPPAIPQLSSASNEHYSPVEVVEAARELMGGIDLDPASCHEANQTVRAQCIYTEADDGLIGSWVGVRGVDTVGKGPGTRVFLNPPGGPLRIGKKPVSQAALWWTRLVLDWLSGDVEQAVFVGFTLEILRTSQGARLPVQRFHRCYPRERLRFSGDQPTHANVLVYLPPMPQEQRNRLHTLDHESHWEETFRGFLARFSSLGFCEPGYW